MSSSNTPPVTWTARVRGLFAEVDWGRVDRWLLLALIAAFLISDLRLLQAALSTQPFGNDFLPLWTGARADPARLYDFGYITDRQSWLYAEKVRPFVYPPSALLLFKSLALLPFWPAYIALVAASGALFLWTGTKLGADGRPLLAATPLLLVAMAGQVTFLVGALVMAALMARGRPIVSGLLFGLAGAIKPQLLVLLPLALVVQGNWRAFWTTGATAIACGLLSLPFGASWVDWFHALPRFSDLVRNDPGLVATTLTPYARWGAVSYVFTIPAALAAVWFAFRRGHPAQQLLALVGGALLVAPYAMNYEIALVIPGVLALRRPLLWSLPFWWALLYFFSGPLPLTIAMALLFVSLLPDPPRPAEA